MASLAAAPAKHRPGQEMQEMRLLTVLCVLQGAAAKDFLDLLARSARRNRYFDIHTQIVFKIYKICVYI